MINFKYTSFGLAEIASGKALVIDKVGFGDQGYPHSVGAISLRSERVRVAPSSAVVKDNKITLITIISGAQTFNILEIGIYLDNGVLLCLWSSLIESAGRKVANTIFKITIVLELAGVNASSVSFTINNFAEAELQSHINDKNNPHAVSVLQIGAATSADLNTHTRNKNNPHNVTASQIGAATQRDFGLHLLRRDNPHQVTAAQVGAVTGADLSPHIGNKNNPHDVTTSQIGAATSADLNTHTRNKNNPHNVTTSKIGAATSANLNAHTRDKSNPHSVTAGQIGAITQAQLDRASTPVGSIIAVAAGYAQRGYLYCDGSFIDKGNYSALFSLIGGRFGANRTYSFKLPDLRGEFIRGFDGGRGVDAGRVLGSFQESTGIINAIEAGGLINPKNVDGWLPGSKKSDPGFATHSVYKLPDRRWFTIRPRNISLMFFIKY